MSRIQWHSDWVGFAGFPSTPGDVLAAKRVGKPVFLSVDIGSSLHGTRVMLDAERGIVETVLELA